MELVTLLLNVHPKVEQLVAVVQLGNYTFLFLFPFQFNLEAFKAESI